MLPSDVMKGDMSSFGSDFSTLEGVAGGLFAGGRGRVVTFFCVLNTALPFGDCSIVACDGSIRPERRLLQIRDG